MSEGKTEYDDGAEGCDTRLMGPLAGDGMSRGFLKVFQYCCSGVNVVEGIDGSLTCGSGRTGAAMIGQ